MCKYLVIILSLDLMIIDMPGFQSSLRYCIFDLEKILYIVMYGKLIER